MKALVGKSYPLYYKYKELTYLDARILDHHLNHLDYIGMLSTTEYITIQRALENTYPAYKRWRERNKRND